MIQKITIKCDTCHKPHEVQRTEEIPDNVTSLTCNWCPECEDKAEDYYIEAYCYDKLPEPIDPNQLSLL